MAAGVEITEPLPGGSLKSSQRYFCYMVLCSDGSYYTGWSNDPARRVRQHNLGKGGRYTRSRLPVQLIHLEEFPDQSSAMRREVEIKRMERHEKEQLVNRG